MNIKKLTLGAAGFPEVLRNIASPPKALYHAGAPLNELLKRPRVAIVGSRNASVYGEELTTELAGRLAEQGVVVVGADLLEQSRLDVSQFNQVLTMLELGGKIRPLGANHWALH